jgi:hypothetical protein
MRVTRRGSVIHWILLAFVTGANLAAQSGPQPSLEQPRYPGWVFTPSIAFGGGWDDNVLLANRANDPPSDYTSPIGPSASLDFTGKRTRFSTAYSGALTLYRSVDELNSFEHSLRVAFHQRLTPKLSIVAEENFARSPTTDAIELVGVPFYRVGSRTNTLGGGVDLALSKYTTLSTRYSLRNVAFEDDTFIQRGLLGGHAHEASALLSRALSTRLTVSGNYNYLRGTEGQGTRVTPVSANGTFEIQSGRAAATYRLTEFVSFTGGVGIARMSGIEQLASTVSQASGVLTSASPALTSSEIGPTFQGGVTWRGEHHLASLTYQRSFIPSFGFGGTFQNEEWVATLRVPFARNRAYTDTAFAWFNNEPLVEIQPTLRSLFFSGKLGYRVSRWLNAEAYYERSQQNAQVAGSKLDRNQAGFRFVATRPMRLR